MFIDACCLVAKAYKCKRPAPNNKVGRAFVSTGCPVRGASSSAYRDDVCTMNGVGTLFTAPGRRRGLGSDQRRRARRVEESDQHLRRRKLRRYMWMRLSRPAATRRTGPAVCALTERLLYTSPAPGQGPARGQDLGLSSNGWRAAPLPLTGSTWLVLAPNRGRPAGPRRVDRAGVGHLARPVHLHHLLIGLGIPGRSRGRQGGPGVAPPVPAVGRRQC